jgi:hypothetical protein
MEPRKFSHDFQFPNNQRAKIMVEYYTLKIKRLRESSKIKISANNYYKFNFFLKKENTPGNDSPMAMKVTYEVMPNIEICLEIKKK